MGASLWERANRWVLAHQLEIGIFLFALVIRLLVIAIAPREGIFGHALGADSADYSNEAQNLLNGHGFSREWSAPYLPDAIRTPLYPLWLASIHLAFGSFVPVIFIEAVLSSLLPVIGMRMTQFFVRDWRFLLGVGIFLSAGLDYAFNTIFFGSEGLSVILLSWALYEILCIARNPRPYRVALWAGLALGLATLTRPITYYLPVFLLPLFAYAGYLERRLPQLLKAFGLLLAVFALVLSPWVVRNYMAFGHAAFDTVGWYNVYTRLAATVLAMDDGDDYMTALFKSVDRLSTLGYIHHPPPVTELEIQRPELMPVLRSESLRIFSEHKRALLIFLLGEPFEVLTQDNTLALFGVLFNLHAPSPPAFSATLYAAQHGVGAAFAVLLPYLTSLFLLHYVMRAFWLVFAFAAFVGAWILWRRNERFAALFLFGFIGYVILFTINAGATIVERYRMQFLMPELVLVVVALEHFFTRWRMRRTSHELH